ncbi:DUF2062 domain-containing protein [Nitratifractor salsuginis]|uniref:DUF2062 domain-containing protein n=1 Tax=Nitratifractor salsuginis (strain DSM 16511 / JCM 12458 / E9I37-1) TaxID=749222 RepID=E6WZR9_NITSE|nr:DUF2062 domain-containing protein [Nitratifractor salsuginis]ADV46710.1 Protein of unknown function DUF2062 [Nitratifractor salsuginis DSM 16511]
MIRRLFKRKSHDPDSKLGKVLEKYHIPKEYFAINRRMVSRGVLVGLFWGFIPMPFQMLAVIFTTPLLRFNVPIAISMVWLSNPLTMPAMYYMEYKTGNLFLGLPGLENVELSIEWFKHHLEDIFLPLYVGTAFYSIIISYLVYLLINRLWVLSVHREKHRKEQERRQRKEMIISPKETL